MQRRQKRDSSFQKPWQRRAGDSGARVALRCRLGVSRWLERSVLLEPWALSVPLSARECGAEVCDLAHHKHPRHGAVMHDEAAVPHARAHRRQCIIPSRRPSSNARKAHRDASASATKTGRQVRASEVMGSIGWHAVVLGKGGQAAAHAPAAALPNSPAASSSAPLVRSLAFSSRTRSPDVSARLRTRVDSLAAALHAQRPCWRRYVHCFRCCGPSFFGAAIECVSRLRPHRRPVQPCAATTAPPSPTREASAASAAAATASAAQQHQQHEHRQQQQQQQQQHQQRQQQHRWPPPPATQSPPRAAETNWRSGAGESEGIGSSAGDWPRRTAAAPGRSAARRQPAQQAGAVYGAPASPLECAEQPRGSHQQPQPYAEGSLPTGGPEKRCATSPRMLTSCMHPCARAVHATCRQHLCHTPRTHAQVLSQFACLPTHNAVGVVVPAWHMKGGTAQVQCTVDRCGNDMVPTRPCLTHEVTRMSKAKLEACAWTLTGSV
eukprot:15759-Chlamydomonas_euryale.AAC.5